MNYLVIFLLSAILNLNVFAENDWPQFLGPNRSGQVFDKHFKPWQTPLIDNWSIEVGEGFGGPIIDGTDVFLLDREESEKDILKCLDLTTGSIKWKLEYISEGRFGFNGTRSVPAVDDKYVFTIGCMGDIICADKKNGNQVWHRNLIKDWQAPSPPWGFGSSPLLFRDLCIVAPLGEVGLVALNKQTGETVWESKSIGTNAGYSSPIIHEILGQKMLFQMSGDRLAAVNPETGNEIFSWDGYKVKRAIPAPVKITDNKIFITGGYQQGSVLLQLKREGTKILAKEIFKINKIGSQIHAPILHEGFLYGNFNENDNLKKRAVKQGLTCFDLTGEMMWKTGEKPNLDRGSVIMINDFLIALDGKTGHLILSEANSKAYNEIFRQRVFGNNGDKIWAPIAYSKGNLLIRDQKVLKCMKIY